MANQSGKTRVPALSSRKLALRYRAPPLTAPTKLPMSDRAISAWNSTGTSQVGNWRGSSRSRVRCAAVRPTTSGDARSPGASARLYQPSRCIASPSPAISAQPRLCEVPRSAPRKPCEFAYTLTEALRFSDAPSELPIRGSTSRPACSQARARSIARCASMSHGCQLSNSRRVVAISAASARPAAASSSVWRAIAQACATVASRLSSRRSAVLALPLRWPKYTVTEMPRSWVASTVSTSPMRTFTARPVSSLQVTSAWLAPLARARSSRRSAIADRRCRRAGLSSRAWMVSRTCGADAGLFNGLSCGDARTRRRNR